jgi:hypothetical protein
MYIQNGVVQGTVISVTLFLVAMAVRTNQIRQPVEILGYAGDWEIFTSDRDMETAETNMQTALGGVAKWTDKKDLKSRRKKQYACILEWVEKGLFSKSHLFL